MSVSDKSFHYKFGLFVAICGVLLLLFRTVIQDFSVLGILSPIFISIGGLLLMRGKPEESEKSPSMSSRSS